MRFLGRIASRLPLAIKTLLRFFFREEAGNTLMPMHQSICRCNSFSLKLKSEWSFMMYNNYDKFCGLLLLYNNYDRFLKKTQAFFLIRPVFANMGGCGEEAPPLS